MDMYSFHMFFFSTYLLLFLLLHHTTTILLHILLLFATITSPHTSSSYLLFSFILFRSPTHIHRMHMACIWSKNLKSIYFSSHVDNFFVCAPVFRRYIIFNLVEIYYIPIMSMFPVRNWAYCSFIFSIYGTLLSLKQGAEAAAAAAATVTVAIAVPHKTNSDIIDSYHSQQTIISTIIMNTHTNIP